MAQLGRSSGAKPEVSILPEPVTDLANRMEALLAWVPA